MHAQFCSTWWNSKKLQAATFHILPGFVCIEINFFSRRFILCPSWLNYKTTLSSRHIQSDHQFYPTIIDEKPNSNLIQFGSRATKRWKFQKTFPFKLVFALPRLFIQVVFNKLAKVTLWLLINSLSFPILQHRKLYHLEFFWHSYMRLHPIWWHVSESLNFHK